MLARKIILKKSIHSILARFSNGWYENVRNVESKPHDILKKLPSTILGGVGTQFWGLTSTVQRFWGKLQSLEAPPPPPDFFFFFLFDLPNTLVPTI